LKSVSRKFFIAYSSARLRNLMLDLKELIRVKKEKTFINAEFIDCVKKYLSIGDFQKTFDEYIIQSKSISWDNQKLLPFFAIENGTEGPTISIKQADLFLAHYQCK